MATSKVFTGVVWASVQRFGTMIISFVTNIVLARLLTPDDFGTLGMLFIFLAIANTFVDSGFGLALIQKKNAGQIDFSTVFFINLVMSFVVYIVLFFSAPWVANFYDLDILRPLLRVQGIMLILQAFSIIQTAMLRKKMDFKKLSICNLIGNIAGSILGILAALKGFGVWSLVVRNLVVGFTTSLLLWIIGKWKPFLEFSKQSFKELFGFGGFMLLSSIIYQISNNVQTLVIGKLFTPAALGNYTQARQLRNVATDSVSAVIGQVLYPDFANNQTNDKLLEHKLNLSVSVISFLAVGLMALCILVAKPLVVLLYGVKWIDSVLLFQILCTAGCFVAIQDVNINLVAAKGKSKMLFYCNLVKMFIFILMLYTGAKVYGVVGLVVANTIYSIIAYLFYSILSSHYVKSSVWGQYKRLFLNIVNIVVPVVAVMLVNSYLIKGINGFAILFVDTVLFFPLYWFISTKVKNEGCLYLNNIILNIYKNRTNSK